MSPAQEFKEDHPSQRVPCKHHGALQIQIARGNFHEGATRKRWKQGKTKMFFEYKSWIIHNYICLNPLLYCILSTRNSCFSLKINLKKNCVLKHECASYSTPWFLPMKGQLLIDTCIPCPLCCLVVRMMLVETCQSTVYWLGNGIQDLLLVFRVHIIQGIHYLSCRTEKLVPASCLSGSSRECQKMIS